ncbi:MAG: phytanoyl-CoA dioxygenase family protein [Candidatus Latescibacterota bacterium]|nr:phytanoyl-CoA dioxygenase family protein [Candidatus Latescibacterota bacterium]
MNQFLPTSHNVQRLTDEEKTQYRSRGYVRNLPVFDDDEVILLQHRFEQLLALLPEGTDINKINCWHKANRWVSNLCRTPAILDYAEDVLGPDFFQWGCQFFCKLPGVSSEVPWHQDAHYWPLMPQETTTVWLAFYDTDASNGAMKVVAGSHDAGMWAHSGVSGEQFVLAQSVDPNQIDEADVVTIGLKAGEMSLHDDRLVHGSGPSESGQRRVGLTMRFSPTRVRCDLSVWPTFESYLVRGKDRYRHNPEGTIPSGDGAPSGMFQPSSNFA